MNNRLKLYDTSVEVVLDSKLKKETKKIAFSNQMTMSAYIRNLIKIGNAIYKHKITFNDLKNSDKEIIKLLGGIFNE